MFIVDAHLDLAYNVTRGRDVTKPAREQPVLENKIATVGLPDLRAGKVGLICATIFCEPVSDEDPHGYRNAQEAHRAALVQIEWYQKQSTEGELRMVPAHGLKGRVTNGLHAILLLEGADPIRTIEDVKHFFDAGVRIVGMAWKGTRYAGGTAAPGPLTRDGIELVRELDHFGIIHDASHLAEESFWQLLELTSGPIIASHSNCRAIVGEDPHGRHLTDEMIRAIAKRGGVIGINFFDKFLLPHNQYGKRRAMLGDVVTHIKHICDLTGSTNHVGLGTDMDGGLGREQIPIEIETSADLPRVAEALHAAGFSGEQTDQIMGGNWLRYFRQYATRAGGSDMLP
jgi:membrane dipeptidase